MKTAPIPAVLPVPTASSIYPQELPPKLVRKILGLQFIEMTELVPNAWKAEELDYQCCRPAAAAKVATFLEGA